MIGNPPMLSSEARVSTGMPRRYLGQLCKHFQHKLPVTLEETHGRITFPAGVCELDALTIAGTLTMRIVAGDEAALTTLEDVLGRHLKRFAFRDELEVLWTRLAGQPHRA
jgi:hypothetical protein